MSLDRLTFVVSEDGSHFESADAQRFEADRSCIYGVLDPAVTHLVATAAAGHVSPEGVGSAITLIVEDVRPPCDDRTRGLEVMSFLVSGEATALLRGLSGAPDIWCYALMERVLSRAQMPCEVRVVHRASSAKPSTSRATCDVIIPHRGLERHVLLGIDSLLRQTHSADIHLVLDQDDVGASLSKVLGRRGNIYAYRLSPNPVGPYVARHVMAMRSRAEFVAFQDSDDASLPHRLGTLMAAAERFGAGIVGSHELQVHERDRKVYAIFYPLDVNAALQRTGAQHQLLFPTSVVRRDVFQLTSGFSTCRAFSLDVAFWLSASRTTKVINVDEFLYVRRRHCASLTMRQDIGSDSQLRRALVAQRRADFAAIVEGRLCLEESSLAVRHRSGEVMFEDLRTGVVTPVRLAEAENPDRRAETS